MSDASKAPASKKGAGASSRKKASAKKKQEAAVTEGDGERTFEWRGLELTIADEVPASFAFDAVEFEASGGTNYAAIRLLTSLLGASQVGQVRNLVASEPVDELGKILGELLSACMAEAGLTPGE